MFQQENEQALAPQRSTIRTVQKCAKLLPTPKRMRLDHYTELSAPVPEAQPSLPPLFSHYPTNAPLSGNADEETIETR